MDTSNDALKVFTTVLYLVSNLSQPSLLKTSQLAEQIYKRYIN